MRYLTQPVNRLLLHRSLYSPHFRTKSFENVDVLMVAMETVKGVYTDLLFRVRTKIQMQILVQKGTFCFFTKFQIM